MWKVGECKTLLLSLVCSIICSCPGQSCHIIMDDHYGAALLTVVPGVVWVMASSCSYAGDSLGLYFCDKCGEAWAVPTEIGAAPVDCTCTLVDSLWAVVFKECIIWLHMQLVPVLQVWLQLWICCLSGRQECWCSGCYITGDGCFSTDGIWVTNLKCDPGHIRNVLHCWLVLGTSHCCHLRITVAWSQRFMASLKTEAVSPAKSGDFFCNLNSHDMQHSERYIHQGSHD